MTPTEQDKELREELHREISHRVVLTGQKFMKTKVLEDWTLAKEIMPLIDQYVERVALEARLNELQNAYEHWINGRSFISSYFRDRITLLSNAKESKDEQRQALNNIATKWGVK